MLNSKISFLFSRIQNTKGHIKRLRTSFINSINRHGQKDEKTTNTVKWLLLGIPATSFALGCWQVSRLKWKLGFIDSLQAKTNIPPIDMPTDISLIKDMEYMPVKVKGQFLHDKEILIGPRALIEAESMIKHSNSLVADTTKNQGWLVITPFRLENGEVIIVNRGWIPSQLRPKSKRQDSMVDGEVELTGVVRLSEKRPPFMPKNRPETRSWFYRDLEQLSEYFGCSPVWIDAKGIPDPPDGWPIPNQTRLVIRNEHLSYIVTWFSLSAVTALMWQRYFIRKLPLL